MLNIRIINTGFLNLSRSLKLIVQTVVQYLVNSHWLYILSLPHKHIFVL